MFSSVLFIYNFSKFGAFLYLQKLIVMVAKQIILKGRVQGVGFRYFIYQKAHMLGIRGFVRNEPDGTVYVEAEAPDQQTMQTFIDYLKRDPSLAHVENILVSDIPPKNYNAFIIK